MIPTIESIVEMLIAGECTAQQAIAWIAQHMENADLRDHFAAHAPEPPKSWHGGERATQDVVEWRWWYADAMLKARQP